MANTEPPVPAGYVSNLFDLKGRVAVVTGGGSGLGQAISIGYPSATARPSPSTASPTATSEAAGAAGSQGVAPHAQVRDSVAARPPDYRDDQEGRIPTVITACRRSAAEISRAYGSGSATASCVNEAAADQRQRSLVECMPLVNVLPLQ